MWQVAVSSYHIAGPNGPVGPYRLRLAIAVWGPKRFLIFYVVCGLAAGIAQLLLGNGPAVGASGAIRGLLVDYGYTFPNTQLFVFPIPFPIKSFNGVVPMFLA